MGLGGGFVRNLLNAVRSYGQVGYGGVRMEGEMTIAHRIVLQGAIAAAAGFVSLYSLAPKHGFLSQAEVAEEAEIMRRLDAAAMLCQKRALINRERALKSCEEAAMALKEAEQWEQGASV